MIFATDLDNTMIFSYKRIGGYENDVYCVEYFNGKPLTYMTHTSIEKLKSLMQKIHVIPITTRTLAQFNRIELFSSTPYAVVDNGGTILQNGMVHKDWEKYINSILQNYNLENVLNVFSKLPGLTLQPRLVDGKFVFAKSDNIELCKQILNNELDTKIWQLSFQHNKLYAIPMEITKGNALKFISENLICDNLVVSSGDSNLDLSMLEYSNIAIIPSDCSLALLEQSTFVKTGSGIFSSDAILDFVTKLSVETQRKNPEKF